MTRGPAAPSASLSRPPPPREPLASDQGVARLRRAPAYWLDGQARGQGLAQGARARGLSKLRLGLPRPRRDRAPHARANRQADRTPTGGFVALQRTDRATPRSARTEPRACCSRAALPTPRRTSCEYLFLPAIAPPSRGMKSPTSPGRFRLSADIPEDLDDCVAEHVHQRIQCVRESDYDQHRANQEYATPREGRDANTSSAAHGCRGTQLVCLRTRPNKSGSAETNGANGARRSESASFTRGLNRPSSGPGRRVSRSVPWRRPEGPKSKRCTRARPTPPGPTISSGLDVPAVTPPVCLSTESTTRVRSGTRNLTPNRLSLSIATSNGLSGTEIAESLPC